MLPGLFLPLSVLGNSFIYRVCYCDNALWCLSTRGPGWVYLVILAVSGGDFGESWAVGGCLGFL